MSSPNVLKHTYCFSREEAVFESNDSVLTHTEREVLMALIRSGSVTAASRRTGRTLGTVRVHLKHIHGKTNTHTVGELIVWALQHPERWAS